MKFNPKFTSYRSRLGWLNVVLWIDAFSMLQGHRISTAGIVILAVATTLAVAIPESPGPKVKPEKYPLT